MSDKSIAIRVDNSSFIGIGHTQRCLYIAKELKKLNYNIFFIVRDLAGSDYSNISSKGFKVVYLSSNNLIEVDEKDHSKWLCVDSDLDSKETKECLKSLGCKNLLVDHYGIDHIWENQIKEDDVNLFIIDDLDRNHNCQLLIDYSFWKKEKDFSKFRNVNDFAIGKDFFPLDQALRDYPKKLINLENPAILISVGGHDKEGLTERIITSLENLQYLPHSKIMTVINKDIFDRISSLIYDSHLNFELHVSPNGLGEIYNQADLCIGSSGISALERCFFCIPSLLILKAKNQLNLGNKLQEYGLANSIKLDDDLKLDKEIQVFLNDSKRNLEMHKKCINFLTLDGSKNIASKIERASQN